MNTIFIAAAITGTLPFGALPGRAGRVGFGVQLSGVLVCAFVLVLG